MNKFQKDVIRYVEGRFPSDPVTLIRPHLIDPIAKVLFEARQKLIDSGLDEEACVLNQMLKRRFARAQKAVPRG